MTSSDSLPSELLRLLKKRDVLKKSMMSIQAYVDKFNPVSKSLTQLQTRLDKLVQSMSTYDTVQGDIEAHDSATTDMLDDRNTVDDFFCTLKAQILDLVEGNNKEPANSSTSQSHTVIRDSMKLPSIPAPIFNGNLQNWVSFLDTFNAMFHDNQGLSDVQRLHYLKSCLSETAAEVIRTIPTTEGNYRMAYDTLVERYENKSLIIQSHVRSLFQTQHVQRPTATELRKLHHHVVSQVRALKALGQPVSQWDAWLVTLVCCRLDPTTVGEWQLLQTSRELPKFDDIEKFLSNRVSAYEVGEIGNQSFDSRQQFSNVGRATARKVFLANHAEVNASTSKKCLLCDGSHTLFSCEKFDNMPFSERKDFVFKNKLCYNCLHPGHQVRLCRSSNCSKCNKRHNTKLHDDSFGSSGQGASSSSLSNNNVGPAIVAYVKQGNRSNHSPSSKQVLLATSIVMLSNATGQLIPCRAILDSGSQVCLITSECVKKLKLNKTKSSLSISGVSSVRTQVDGMIQTTMSSRFNDFIIPIDFHVLDTITNNLPIHRINAELLSIPNAFSSRLADPQFGEPSSIDILLGAEIFFNLLIGESVKISPHVTLHNTSLGWVFTGSVPIQEFQPLANSLLLRHNTKSALTLDTQLHSNNSLVESRAEIHFKSNVSHDDLGRFVVRLPFVRNPAVLGDSRFMAMQRFYNLERKLSRNPSLASDYKEFMKEYLELGHMELAHPTDGPNYYLPHHSVFKSNSSTTKMRVVFDGSAVTKSGLSLNDILICGPTVQPDLLSIILRFRIHKIALTADIAKMYRQIRVSPEDCDMQRICYRATPDEPLKDYRLLTVTYGTRAASFLSTRCLLELSYTVTNHATRRAIQQDFYVDDLLSGGQDEAQCYELFQNLSDELNKVSLPLRKWCSNSKSVMSKLSSPQMDSTFLLSINEEDTVSTLGLTWQPSTDCFKFIFKNWQQPLRMTKRTLLSNINSVYDPVGFLTPALIRGKIFMQQLWSSKLNWDTPLCTDMQDKWTHFYLGLKSLEQLSIPRRVPFNDATSVQLHGFCDASQNAFGACIYLRSTITLQCQLYVSKSRVAPLKPTTIPRLELCGALLLAELVDTVINELSKLNVVIDLNNIILWCDSTIVLSWINTEKPLMTYVSNRVAQILDITKAFQWRHVPTSSNPADVISRGCPAEVLIKHELWFTGPKWLSQEATYWPSSVVTVSSDVPEVRTVRPVLVIEKSIVCSLEDRYSSWSKLIRITAWLKRFLSNTRLNTRSERNVGSLSVKELNEASAALIKISQGRAFNQEVIDLKANRSVGRRSILRTLHPFIDDNGLIRVGSRLANSSLRFNSKFPIVLPSKCKLAVLIFEYEHKRLLHIGPQGLLANIHTHYWPIRGRILARQTIRRCITCFRASPKLVVPFMAPLPRERVTIERPFTRTGVDFCGPISIRSGIRRVVSIKCYISVFVCFVTRAIHLELVSGLTSSHFLAALSRFMSRRGQCSHLYSDNGTNFVGANKVLHTYFTKIQGHRSIEETLSEQNIQWHFIPPSAPNFGGLWEAAVKSTKNHLLKINGMGLLTFEEMNTLLCKIEAVLNSRPISPVSDNPSDYTALTPGHFLVGGILTLPTDPDYTGIPLNRVKRWELVKLQAQMFWKRWSSEYLPQLHKRGRWLSHSKNISVGTLAILKDDNVPLLHWKLVRVVKVHPGTDGVVRVVTVRNSVGREFQRPTSRLAPLPSCHDEEDPFDLPTNVTV